MSRGMTRLLILSCYVGRGHVLINVTYCVLCESTGLNGGVCLLDFFAASPHHPV